MDHFNISDLVRDYLAGESAKNLASKYSTTPWIVKQRLVGAGVQLRSGSDTAKLFNRGPTGPKVIMPPELLAEVRTAYLGGESPRSIAARIGYGANVVYREIARLGIQRSCSEAATLRMRNASVEERKAITEAAHAAWRGRKQSNASLIKSAATRQRRMIFMTPDEITLRECMHSIGYTIVPQKFCDRYNIDIGLKEPRVAVEVQTGYPGSFLYSERARQRIEQLFSDEWRILFVCVRACGFVFPDIAQKVMTFAEIAGRNKPFLCQYGVVRSDGEPLARDGRHVDGWTRVDGF